MQIFKNRPLALWGATLAVLAVLALQFSAKMKIQMILASVLCLTLVIVLMKCRYIKKIGYYLIPILLGVLIAMLSLYLYFNVFLADIRSHVGERTKIEGSVLERTSATTFSSTFRVSLESVDGEERNEDVILEFGYPSALQIGDRFSADVIQRDFVSLKTYNEEQTYLSDGYTRIFVCECVEDFKMLKERNESLRVRLIEWNHKLSSRLYDTIGDEGGGLAVALLLGNRSFLSDEDSLHFRRAGISHLLALSGMHVSILIGFLEFLLRKLHIAKLIRAGIMPVALLGYLAITGFSVSAIRAVLMTCVLYLGFLLRANYDAITALCTILALMLTFTPYAVLDLSLWMSFLAAASIIIFYPWIREVGGYIRGKEPKPFFLRRALAAIVEAILVGVVANAALMLLSAYVFGEASVMSIPATLLLSVPMSLLMIVTLPLFLFAGIDWLAVPSKMISHVMLSAVDSIADMKDILYPIGSKPEIAWLIVFTVLIILLAVLKWKHAISLLIIPVFMITVFALSAFLTDRAQRIYLSATEETGGYAVLCEGGEMIAVDYAANYGTDASSLLSLAKLHRCTEIGDLVMTKYNNRRPYLIHYLSSRIHVSNIRLPIPKNDSERAIAKRIEQEAELHHIKVFYHIEGLEINDVGDP